MADENTTTDPKITAVCGHCRQHNSTPVLEINFRDKKIFYICPGCNKESKLNLTSDIMPFPKTRMGR
tara:strand:+ start:458 stop:658 length:201 start_codon:yes stop_codon:yes gene_type:complete